MSFSVPLTATVVSINIGLLISIVAATSVRCLNVLVCGIYPKARTFNMTALLVSRTVAHGMGPTVMEVNPPPVDRRASMPTHMSPKGSSALDHAAQKSTGECVTPFDAT